MRTIGKNRGIARDQVEYSDVTAAKRLLVENLSPYCSSMLFDPNFAVPAAIDVLPARCGLIMTLEEHRVEETAGGRKSRAITNWSVEKIRAMGGDAVKVLAWYRPDADAAVNEHQKRFVREIGVECAGCFGITRHAQRRADTGGHGNERVELDRVSHRPRNQGEQHRDENDPDRPQQ